MTSKRSGLLRIDTPVAPDAPAGTCCWCGATLTGSGASRRHYCYPEREGHYCRNLSRRARAWNPRAALLLRAARDFEDLRCEDCGFVCEELQILPERRHVLQWVRSNRSRDGVYTDVYEEYGDGIPHRWVPHRSWEADHGVALADGGEHTLENLFVRCVDCHRAKTSREAAERVRLDVRSAA